MRNVDNIGKIKDFLKNSWNPDYYYFVQIIIRGKDDNPSIKGNNKYRIVKYYTFSSEKEFNDNIEEIKTICQALNARAYINLNKRNWKDATFAMLEDVTKRLKDKRYNSVRSSFSHCTGKLNAKRHERYYIIDVDENKSDKEISDFIAVLQNEYGCANITIFETINGYHFVVPPFNVDKFNENYNHDVHKNGSTLLFYNKKI